VCDDQKVCTGRDLAAALVNTRLSEEEARAWYGDLRNTRRQIETPDDSR
jgi:hypothetical protein